MKTINDENVKEKKSIKIKLISIFIFLFFDILFIILSLCNIKRIGGVLLQTSALRYVFIYFFYIIGVALLIYYGYILIYIYYKKRKNEITDDKIDKLLFRFDLLLFVGKIITILDFICIFMFTPSFVVGSSMSPTYENGDFTIASNMFLNLKDNDIIIFVSPNGDNDFYVKRIIASPKDKVEIKKIGTTWCFFVNDTKKDEFEVGYPEDLISKYGSSFTIPKNKYFVMGDNRYNSNDSRSFGLIDKDSILGKVIIHF